MNASFNKGSIFSLSRNNTCSTPTVNKDCLLALIGSSLAKEIELIVISILLITSLQLITASLIVIVWSQAGNPYNNFYLTYKESYLDAGLFGKFCA